MDMRKKKLALGIAMVLFSGCGETKSQKFSRTVNTNTSDVFFESEESPAKFGGAAATEPAPEFAAGPPAIGAMAKVAYKTKTAKRHVNFPRDSTNPVERAGSEGYEHHGTNPFVDPNVDHLSTFAVDVDTGSFTVARRKLNEGQIPPAASVRVEEFINYFGYDYTQPKRGPFAVDIEAAPSPFSTDQDTLLMRVGVQGKSVSGKERKPVHLTFLIDVSGSMERPDKLGLAKRSLQLLTNQLGPQDTVAIATYAGRVAEILEPTGADERGKILAALEELQAGGSTAMNDGLTLAYRLALRNFHRNHVNRVIVVSDGDANVGPSSHEEILTQIRSYVDEGVTLSTIGFGTGNYQDSLMEQLANKGNGNYYYIDSIEEARKIFGDQIDGTLQVIAKDVKIQVEFNPDAVQRYRLIGYENRAIADRDFRNDRVDAGEIGAGHTVTALYEVQLKQEFPRDIATVRIRHKEPTGYRAEESAYPLTSKDIVPKLMKASADFRFAASVASFAEILRGSPYAEKLNHDIVLEIANGALQNRKDRKEFVALVERAKALR
jgi:Ca-activated chloride channel homolog